MISKSDINSNLNKKNLIDYVAAIFQNDTIHTSCLYADSDRVNKELEYIDKQIDHITGPFDLSNNKKGLIRFCREVTHKSKVVKINIQLYRTITFKEGTVITDNINWCVVGPDLQEVFRFLPRFKRICNDETTIWPKIGTKHSRWYPYPNSQIKQIALDLRLLQLYISTSNQKVQPRLLADSTTNVTGVLDLDIKVDYTIPEKLLVDHRIDLMSYVKPFMSNKGNPYRKCDGTIIYNKNGVASNVINDIFEMVQIPGVFSCHIHLFSDLSAKEDFVHNLTCMKNSKSRIALMSINMHTMFWLKHNDVWYLCDPVRKQFRLGINHHKFCADIFDEILGHWRFLPRSYSEQQSNEGSCSIASLARILQTSVTLMYSNEDLSFEELYDMINRPIECWSAMIASCLVRSGMLRVRDKQKINL